MERKPQQQTLSIRISEALREFLERSRTILSNGRGELVSASDVAKMMLESAKNDRLDFRLEVAELQESATKSMWAIRRKWEQRRDLSRAEWTLLTQYIQVACEEVTEDPAMPPSQAFAVLLEAMLAVRGLRVGRDVELDNYYLGNLGADKGATFNERLDPDVVPGVVAKLLHQLRESPGASKPTFAGRNLYVAIRDEKVPDIVALNVVLFPHLETLFRLAARGHWIREHRPIRSLRDAPIFTDSIPSVVATGFRLSFNVSSYGDLSMLISMDEKDLLYPLNIYPEIREFFAMLERLSPSESWHGFHFDASAVQFAPEKPARIYFHRRHDGIRMGFSPEEWQCLRELFAKAMASPRLQRFFEELSLVYGEL